jgi:hypothetical protein
MLIVVEKNESGEDGEAYSSLSIKAKWPFMETGRPSPLKVQISQEGDYKPGFLEAVKKRFRVQPCERTFSSSSWQLVSNGQYRSCSFCFHA